MFYEGDLQSGIALAVQESKCVVCFVRDDGEESTKWETEWLAGNERIVDYLQRNAVTLRLRAGSQEAGFLSSFYPVASVPALVMIDQGKVEQTLLSGVNQDAFTPALIGALSRIEHRKRAARHPAAAPAAASPPPTTPSTPPQPTAQDPPPSETATQTDRQARIQTLLDDRRQRLEADKKAKDAAEKGKQKERAQSREAGASSSSTNNGKRSAEQTYAQQQKQAKLEAAKEKERIRKLVEHDKLQRKEREEQRRALARAEREAAAPSPQQQDDEEARTTTAASSADKVDRRGCMVQVRLLDGSTMRAHFFPEDKPSQALRKWIDGSRVDGDYPYTFKQIMTPAPSKVVSDADEQRTLRELGMTPSATLVLVPVKGVVAAYQGGGATALLNTFLAFVGAMFMGIFDALFGLMQRIMGVQSNANANATSQQQPAAEQSSSTSTATGASKGGQGGEASTNVNIRTLRDQRGKEDHQLYNGNSLDFEPRKDDGADDKGEQGSK